MKKIAIFAAFATCAYTAGATISQIRWGSSGSPLNGLTITWSNNGSADSIKWGYTTSYEVGDFAGTKRSGYSSGISFFKYKFPTVTPSSTIYYKLYDSNAHSWTAQKTFLTSADTSLNAFSFSVLGDCRDYPATLTTVSNLVNARNPDLVLFNGDLTLLGTSASEYNTFFTACSNFLQNNVVYHAEGNHDAGNTSLFSNLWDLPTTNGTNLYYAVRYGNALFITINSTTPSSTAQLNWLQGVLTNALIDPTIKWKIVSMHHAFFTIGNHQGDMDAYRSTIWKAFDDYGVDLVVTGHDHNYQRSKPVNLNVSTTAPVAQYGSGLNEGRCQIVSGGAGASLYTQGSTNDAWAINLFNSTYNYVHCDVQDCKIVVRAFDQNNAMIDSLVLDKTGTSACATTQVTQVKQKFNPISIYPNPAESNFTLHYSSEQIGEAVIQLYDGLGREVGSEKAQKTKTDFDYKYDVSKYPKGIYNVSITVSGQRDNAVLVISK
jgi:3',5'-cyclic AMP phosphodiesterase CpdA